MRCTIRNFFSRKHKVVRTSLDCNRQPFGTGAAQGRNCVGRRKMDDVDADAEFPAQPDHQFDGFVLGSARPGLQIRFVAPCRVLYSSGIDGTGQFCVNKQHAAVRGNKGQDLPEICFSYVRKFINSRRHEEALESEYTRGDQRLASTFERKASTVVVAGMLLSGISISVVTPPAAAARVP